MPFSRLPLLLAGTLLSACPGSGPGIGSGDDDDSAAAVLSCAGPNPADGRGRACFAVEALGRETVHELNSDAGNLVSCTDAASGMLEVLLALDPYGGGDYSTRVELRICNADLGGAYLPLDPWSGCGDSAEFQLSYWEIVPKISQTWWYAPSDASPCVLALSEEGDLTLGSFSCARLINEAADDIAITAGTFACERSVQ